MRLSTALSVVCSSASLLWGVGAYPSQLERVPLDLWELPPLDFDAPVARIPWKFAFVFDIDGVLLRGNEKIPGILADETLEWLDKHHIPFVLLTNGGGRTEQSKIDQINENLGTDLSEDHIILSHTPFRALVDGPEQLRHKTVLVTGSDYEKCRAILKNYGFESVVTPGDIWKAEPHIFPFVKDEEKHLYDHLAPLPKPIYQNTTFDADTDLSGYLKIDAMFILNDVRDWALDYQIFSDLLLSHKGYLGTVSKKNALGPAHYQQDGQPSLYFSNADLLWGSHWHMPRYGQGSTKASFEGLWSAHTGGAELKSYAFGKPTELAFQYAEKSLNDVREKLFNELGYTNIPPLKHVYMFGDSPESDIGGPNTYVSENGTEWLAMLVGTGMYKHGQDPRPTGIQKPLAYNPNVNMAVRDALVREKVLAPKKVLQPRPSKL